MKKYLYYIVAAAGGTLIIYGIGIFGQFDFGIESLHHSTRGKSGYSGVLFVFGGGVGMVVWAYFELKMLESNAQSDAQKSGYNEVGQNNKNKI
jgi:hypothetical protein